MSVTERLRQQAVEERRAAKFDYDATAFMLKKPYHDSVHKGPFRLRDRDAHRKLVAIARQHGLYVWFARLEWLERHGRQVPCAVGHHLIDWDSMPDSLHQTGIGKGELKDRPSPVHNTPSNLKCSVCGQQCTSASGLTLHMKTHGNEGD